MTPIFLFGTLLDDALRGIVLGEDVPAQAAVLPAQAVVLPGEAAWAAAGGAYPVLAEGERANGLLVHLGAEALARGDYYEGLFGYARRPVTVQADGAPVAAEVWRPTDRVAHDGVPWALMDWQEPFGPVSRVAAAEVMALRGQRDATETARRLPMIRARAQARVNAGVPGPATLRRGGGGDDVEVLAARVPYAMFFAVEEYDLRHVTFAGSMSEPMTRAAFVSGDAVTVLPYDPVRDRVLLIEQFRAGPFARGDARCWSLEAIAGRIDGFETPEEAARREAKEEAGLSLGDLIALGGHYPSPGAKTEYLYTYLALADLPDEAAGLGGLAEEHEDIRAHVIGFEQLMELLESNEVNNGPLVLSALELRHRRAALRVAALG